MSRSAARPSPDADLDSFEAALSSLSLDALRRFTRERLRELDPEARRASVEALLEFAVRHGGWRPTRAADPRLLEDVRAFVRVSSSHGDASPGAIDALFDRVNRAFLAGEMALACDAYEALLRPLADGEIFLGQHEMYSEVLRNHPGDAVARYRVAVWASAPPAQRAEALWNALLWTDDLESWGAPLEQMERAAVGPLPGWEEFLHAWDAWVEAHWSAVPTHRNVHIDALRKEAALRGRGVDGLRQIAERDGSPALWHEWIRSLMRAGRMREALEACDTALARCPPTDYHRHSFADTAVRLSLALADSVGVERALHREWTLRYDVAALLNWAARDRPMAQVLSVRVDAEAATAPKNARIEGVTHLLSGRYQDALKTLATPGAVELLPAMAWILLDGTMSPSLRAIGGPIGLTSLGCETDDDATTSDPPEGWSTPDDVLPAHPAITLAEQLPGLVVWRPLGDEDLREMQSALERAAVAYIDDATSAKHRSAYAHGARLAVVCAEARSRRGDPAGAREFLARVAENHRRWPAFRDALEDAVNASPSVRGALPSRRR